MKILHLTLKKKWFDMIASGEKKEEYREIKDYWVRRFCGKEWYKHEDLHISLQPDKIIFKLGYAKSAPVMHVECKGISVGPGKYEWGGGGNQFVLKLGKIYQVDNI
jgi:hypothetical protein